MNLKMIGAGGKVLSEKPAFVNPNKDAELFDKSKVDPEIMSNFCDKLIRACDLIGENPRTGETKVCDTPEEARAWERQCERIGFNMVTG